MQCPLCLQESNKPIRSLSQNRLYWLYLSVIERDTGNLAQDLHDFFREKLLPPKHVVINGKNGVHEATVVMSTRNLSKSDFAEYLLKIQAYTGIPCPDPHELEGYICGNKSCPSCTI